MSGLVGADGFRQEAELYERGMTCLANPTELYTQIFPESTQAERNDRREQLRAMVRQFRKWQHIAERDAEFALPPWRMWDIIDEMVESIRQQQQQQQQLQHAHEPDGEAHRKDAEEAHRRDAAEAHPVKDAEEAHRVDAAEALPIKDAAEAHESGGTRERRDPQTLVSFASLPTVDCPRGATLEREPAGGDAAVITASRSGATLTEYSAGLGDDGPPAVTWSGASSVPLSAGLGDDDPPAVTWSAASSAPPVPSLSHPNLFSLLQDNDEEEEEPEEPDAAPAPNSGGAATPPASLSPATTPPFGPRVHEQSWIGARRRPWTGVREALDTG